MAAIGYTFTSHEDPDTTRLMVTVDIGGLVHRHAVAFSDAGDKVSNAQMAMGAALDWLVYKLSQPDVFILRSKPTEPA